MTGINSWIGRIAQTPKNYQMDTTEDLQIKISFLNEYVMSNVIEQLWWKLHNCSIQKIIEVYNNSNLNLEADSTSESKSDNSSREEGCQFSTDFSKQYEQMRSLNKSPSVREINQNPDQLNWDFTKGTEESIPEINLDDETIEMINVSSIPAQESHPAMTYNKVLELKTNSNHADDRNAMQSNRNIRSQAQLHTDFSKHSRTPQSTREPKTIFNDPVHQKDPHSEIDKSNDLIDKWKFIDNAIRQTVDSSKFTTERRNKGNFTNSKIHDKISTLAQNAYYYQKPVPPLKSRNSRNHKSYQTFNKDNINSNYTSKTSKLAFQKPVLSTQTITTLNQDTSRLPNKIPFEYDTNYNQKYLNSSKSTSHLENIKLNSSSAAAVAKQEDMPILTQTILGSKYDTNTYINAKSTKNNIKRVTKQSNSKQENVNK